MQTLLLIHCKNNKSLRERISKDEKLTGYFLQKIRDQQPGRSPGWLKLSSTDPSKAGVLNIDWNSNGQFLKCRVINKGKGRPDRIVGDFLGYLMARHRTHITFMTIVPERPKRLSR